MVSRWILSRKSSMGNPLVPAVFSSSPREVEKMTETGMLNKMQIRNERLTVELAGFRDGTSMDRGRGTLLLRAGSAAFLKWRQRGGSYRCFTREPEIWLADVPGPSASLCYLWLAFS